MLHQILTGLFSFQTLIALIVGVCGGTIIGCLPGLSASMGVALLLAVLMLATLIVPYLSL